MDEEINSSTKIKLNFFDKRLYPFFISLPQDVPVDWMIPYLFFIEDFQLLQYAQTEYVFLKQRKFITNILALPNAGISNLFFFYAQLIFYTICIIYLYGVLIYYIKSNGRKSLSKKTLRITNTIYMVLFKYLLNFVFGFLTRCLYVCQENIYGIPTCNTLFANIYMGVASASIVLIYIYCYIYNNYNFNTDCLSHGKYFGSIHKANSNKLLFAKFLMPFFVNEGTNFMITHQLNLRIVSNVVSACGILIFLYLAIFQLKNQPYYSKSINNYRFAVYSSFSAYMAYGVIIGEINLNSSQIICDLSPVLLILFFIGCYFFNNYYYNKRSKRIYKKLYEKHVTENLKNSVSKEGSVNNPVKTKNIYKSVERITKETFVNKEIKVFKNYHECEFACRFLRNNRNIEAFHLMKKIFEEGTRQFKHEADIYIIAWYYIHTMKIFYKNNNLLQKFDMELFNANEILNSAMGLKLDARKKFLIARAESYIEIEKREDSMKINSTDVEASIKLEELKNSVISSHIRGLHEIKELFTKLRNSTNAKDVSEYTANINRISKIQKSANSQYNYIIRKYPDAKDVIRLYILFLTDVSNNDEAAYKLANDNPKLESNSRKTSLVDSPKANDKKALTASNNSLISIPHSEDYSTASGVGKDLKKKINAKNSMTKKFVEPIKNLKLNMTFLIGLFILVFIIQALYIVFTFNGIKEEASILARTLNIPGALKGATYGVRMHQYNLMLSDGRTYGKYYGALKGTLVYLETVNMKSVSDYMDVPTSNELAVPVGEYAYDSYEEKTLADSYKKFISNLKYCLNRGMLRPNETVESILYEPHFKYFIVNSKSNFDLVFDKCKEIINDLIVNKLNNLNIVTAILETVLVIITLGIAYITFSPLNKLTNKISYSSFRMFRFFSKENFEQMITDYEEKIESLCESFDVDKDTTEHTLKREKLKSRKNIKLYITFTVILLYIVVSSLPIITVVSNVNDILKITQKSADRLTLLKSIQLYTYEVINQDRTIFLSDEPERILKDMIDRMETIQEELKTGSYGGPTFDNYPQLEYLIKESGCHRIPQASMGTTCETIVYDGSYGFSEELGTLPVDELIRAYIFNVKDFLEDVEDGKYIRLPFLDKNNIRIMFNQFLNDNFFKLQDGIMDNILGDIQSINMELMDYANAYITEISQLLLTIIIVGIVLFLIIDVFIFNAIYSEKVRDMNALVSFLFLVPISIVNKNDKYKRFLETTQTDE